MARVMKSFNTEAEFEEWANSPQMRTPYTCFVRNTGNVHYFDGDDDDYSITLVSAIDGWVRLYTSRIAPQVYGSHVDSTYHNGEGILYNRFGIKVYKNGEEVDIVNEMAGNLGDKNGLPGPRNNSYRLDKSKRCGWCRRYLFVKKDDVIKITFDKDLLDLDGDVNLPNQPRLAIPHHSLHDITFAKEIVVGDGFEWIRPFSLYLHNNKAKIYIGKNIKRISSYGIKEGSKLIFNATNKKNINIHVDIARMCDFNAENIKFSTFYSGRH